ncbi:hypothetical protein NCS56_01536200 [Fusarium sp. Ph1]|nr:hypothetical protein NCS56_01536200 [Fusarium sp. Ph1]
MEDTIRLLPRAPGASDEDVELQPHPQTPSGPHATPRPQQAKNSPRVVISIVVFWICGAAFFGGHLAFFLWLDEKPVKQTLSQGRQSAAANIFAVFVDISLIGGLGVAYNQILWRLLRQKAFPARVIDKLVHLPGSPWEFISCSMLRQLVHIKRVLIIALLCVGIPFALVFPPGAVSAEFQNQLKETLHNVKTMNISDYGNGTVQQFVEHSLFEVNGDLNYNAAQARPKLKAMAAQVLASGEPVKFDSPCGSSCAYNISLEGPSFRCEEPEWG